MKTKSIINIPMTPNPICESPPIPAVARHGTARGTFATVALACALSSWALAATQAANILENDAEHGFTPTIKISDYSSESVVVERSSGRSIYGKTPNPEKVAATVIGNLAGFPFTEIAEDMPVRLRVGGFAFAATLGQDASRPKNRDGTLRPFDSTKTTAVFLLRANLPPLKPGGAPRLRTVGSVTLAWNLHRVVARLVLADVAAAAADGILTPEAESFPQDSAAVAFSCEKIPVEIAFGSSTGSRTAYARGRLTTLVRRLGSARDGNLTTVALSSMAMVGEADVTAPKLAVTVPTIDEAPLGVITFNGSVADLAGSPLSGAMDLVAIHVLVDGRPLNGGTDEDDDFGLYVTAGDAKGQSLFSVVDLPVAAATPGTVTVSVYATDASGNRSRISETKVSVRGAGQ